MSAFKSGGIIKPSFDNMKVDASAAGGEMLMTGRQIVALHEAIGQECPHDDVELDALYLLDRNGIVKVE